MTGRPRLVLASASPARLATLRTAGLDPEVVVSGVDEDDVGETDPAVLALLLAQRKCAVVAGLVERCGDLGADGVLVLGCDSVLELDGAAYGKPRDADAAIRRWHQMRGRAGMLHTGHSVRLLTPASTTQHVSALASTVVHFADIGDDEIEAYVATGEPLGVAGGFTLDGRGGPYVRAVDGDPHTVVGLGLPLLRELVGELGVRWHHLWAAPRGP